jgi:hypothetical protein
MKAIVGHSFRRLRENIRTLGGRRDLATAGGDTRRIVRRTFFEMFAQFVVTAAIVSICGCMLLADGSDEASKRLACGLLGSITGYWLR